MVVVHDKESQKRGGKEEGGVLVSRFDPYVYNFGHKCNVRCDPVRT